MIGDDVWADPFQAFLQGRLAVDRHMAQMLRDEEMFAEETLTDLLLVEAREFGVRFKKFTKGKESKNGADWLWWWVDASGISFGMLVQAKILKRRFTSWHIDFGYQGNKTRPRQINTLLTTAETFRIPAMHMLYCGTQAYRTSLDCDLRHGDGIQCRDRERSGVSIVPSLIPHYLAPRVGKTLAVEAFHRAMPLEDIADPSGQQAMMRLLTGVVPDVSEFMLTPQVGACRVAKALLALVHDIRVGQFSAAPAAVEPPIDDAVFPDLPSDTGHFAVPYVAHILGGLRRRPPDYVQDVLEGRTPPRWLSDLVAGIVVVRDPGMSALHRGAPGEQAPEAQARHLTVVRSDAGEPAPTHVLDVGDSPA